MPEPDHNAHDRAHDRGELTRTLIVLACLLGIGAAAADVILLLAGAWAPTPGHIAEPIGFLLATIAAVWCIRRVTRSANTIEPHA